MSPEPVSRFVVGGPILIGGSKVALPFCGVTRTRSFKVVDLPDADVHGNQPQFIRRRIELKVEVGLLANPASLRTLFLEGVWLTPVGPYGFIGRFRSAAQV